ncbi:UNVERIFIED_CONTAM: aminotransferase class I/II-fold pyridoxal phosphate-dependent enzyme [Comamonas sp. A-3]|uniref:aminotransferase class I/II-fold pyridoxal phosphate-dependent enzyme n=1 Tax=Comamonas thiooxydans TaxID=363952 RepID=UPI0021157884|nr:aminotransferase class I/II-fold pyridoxal phosphate-dependent enzyme [Comamonas thiooxydans]UUE95607.1 aminotransferase class I/II-fold pyridoxal phosphate-dependent enzyme [Comamonas thiooxydans]
MNKTPLAQQAKTQLIDRILGRKASASQQPVAGARLAPRSSVDPALTRFDRHPGYEKMLVPKAVADRLGLDNPFFRIHEGMAGATSHIAGREFINFSSYNYLGLSGHPEVNQAAKDAIDHYGTSASASRLVAGERPIQRELEQALAAVYGVEDSIVFVSGHATNVSTIGYLFGPKDLVLHDSLIHNSVLQGIELSGAARRPFAHNDLTALDQILAESRGRFERVLIVVEGHYSMDGDIPDLPALIDIKRRHQAFLMVDEAHSLGVLGEGGKGLHEHYGVDGREVDIWMGTLSKTLAGCGGYIAGERALVEHLKYAAPGFVYSVGIAPALAAASLAALRVMQKEAERVQKLQHNTRFFLQQARAAGLDIGMSQGHSIIPLMTGSSIKAAKLSSQLFEHGINVQPILHPAVEEKAARLRFFLSSEHSQAQMEFSIQTIQELTS